MPSFRTVPRAQARLCLSMGTCLTVVFLTFSVLDTGIKVSLADAAHTGSEFSSSILVLCTQKHGLCHSLYVIMHNV